MELNIVDELLKILKNFNNYTDFEQFCTMHDIEVDIPMSSSFTMRNAYTSFALGLKKQKKIGFFLNLLEREKTSWQDVIELNKKWKYYNSLNADQADIFTSRAFDLILFKDNNEYMPFIARDNFKDEIRQTINDHGIGSLRLAINGASYVGTSYLKEYLTNLDKQCKCLPKYIIIDCKTDLLKEQEEDITSAHLAEAIAKPLEIDSEEMGVDVKDPTKFKGALYGRFVNEIKKKCEEKGEGLVLFIDHLHQNMHGEVFIFLEVLLNKFKEFRIPYIVILSRVLPENLKSPKLLKNITLEPFTEDELKRYVIKIFQYIRSKYPEQVENLDEKTFEVESLSHFINLFQPGGLAPVQETQEHIKIWYEELLKELN